MNAGKAAGCIKEAASNFSHLGLAAKVHEEAIKRMLEVAMQENIKAYVL